MSAMIVPITGSTIRVNNVSTGLTKNSVTKVLISIKGALNNSTKLPKILPSTSPTSLDIRDIISPFLCSVKKETGRLRIFLYMALLRSLVTPTR